MVATDNSMILDPDQSNALYWLTMIVRDCASDAEEAGKTVLAESYGDIGSMLWELYSLHTEEKDITSLIENISNRPWIPRACEANVRKLLSLLGDKNPRIENHLRSRHKELLKSYRNLRKTLCSPDASLKERTE